MIKKTPKYIFLFFFAITLITFLFNLIDSYILALINPTLPVKLLIMAISAVCSAGIITFGISVIVPTFSDAMSTLRKLTRVENMSNPLLMKLSVKAPGTYHHSLNVSTIAHKAAKCIGADSLLVRTAAYYHDIGKIENPSAYTENKSDKEEGDYTPESLKENAKEIISHVERGVEIAKKNNIPEEIIDLIREHHGTTYASYFLNKAKELGLNFEQSDFRYEGPRPQTKESIILMLSDCVEATTRATKNLNNDKIKEIVKSTIESKISANQIKNSGISDLELAKLANSFEETLRSIYHQRISYKNK